MDRNLLSPEHIAKNACLLASRIGLTGFIEHELPVGVNTFARIESKVDGISCCVEFGAERGLIKMCGHEKTFPLKDLFLSLDEFSTLHLNQFVQSCSWDIPNHG